MFGARQLESVDLLDLVIDDYAKRYNKTAQKVREELTVPELESLVAAYFKHRSIIDAKSTVDYVEVTLSDHSRFKVGRTPQEGQGRIQNTEAISVMDT